MGCCCSKNTQDEGIRYAPSTTEHQGIKYESPDTGHQGMRYGFPDTEHQGMRYGFPDTEHQGMKYGTQQETKNTGPNEYYEKILNLDTLHKNFMNKKRRYRISVYRGQSFGQHHFIVVSDGDNEDITLELTVAGEKPAILSGQEKVIAAVNIFYGSKSELENKGVVECTLHMLTEIATNVIRNPHYNLLSNNCQDFCNKFLDTLKQETYMTDPQKVMVAGAGTSFAGSAAVTTSALVRY